MLQQLLYTGCRRLLGRLPWNRQGHGDIRGLPAEADDLLFPSDWWALNTCSECLQHLWEASWGEQGPWWAPQLPPLSWVFHLSSQQSQEVTRPSRCRRQFSEYYFCSRHLGHLTCRSHPRVSRYMWCHPRALETTLCLHHVPCPVALEGALTAPCSSTPGICSYPAPVPAVWSSPDHWNK